MDANERFEYMASLFLKETGFLAPSKDSAFNLADEQEREYRNKIWAEWTDNFYSELFILHAECEQVVRSLEK